MIEGADKLQKKLEEMEKVNLKNGIARGIALVQESAKHIAPVHDGELRQKIMTDVSELGDGTIRGTCWANVAHDRYVELGTGPKGQASHNGISPNISPAYTQSPWWIHEGSGADEIDRATAEHYHFPYIETKDGRFYQCTGQPAQPFLYPALKNNEDRITEIIGEELKKQL